MSQETNAVKYKLMIWTNSEGFVEMLKIHVGTKEAVWQLQLGSGYSVSFFPYSPLAFWPILFPEETLLSPIQCLFPFFNTKPPKLPVLKQKMWIIETYNLEGTRHSTFGKLMLAIFIDMLEDSNYVFSQEWKR